MRRNVLPLAAGSALTALLAGCSLSSPDKLETPTLTGDVHLTLLQTTDIHDHVQGTGPLMEAAPGAVGSYARIAAYVNAVRAERTAAGDPVVLVDSGDWTMGSVYDLTIGSQPLATFFLDTLRYDCVTLGNHEFDYTPTGLAEILANSKATFGYHTPIVATNTDFSKAPVLAPYWNTAVTPTYTETLPNGLKVGFFGLMGKDAATAAPAAAPVTFADYSANGYASIQTVVDDLRTRQGCNVVIALSHAGTDSSTGGYTGEDISLAQAVHGIDVIASGHTHNPFDTATANHPVTVNGGTWVTQVICAGAYSANVTRLDLTYHFAGKSTSVDASSNLQMTDAVLAGKGLAMTKDPAQTVFVGQADATLNAALGPLFTQLFPDYLATDLTKGIYHPVGATAQDMVPNDINPVLSPNGLGNLCADADRNIANGIISKVLLSQGWTGSTADPNLPKIMAGLAAAGYDPTFYTAAVIPTGVIRDRLDAAAGPSISFANVYQVLPLGISPDTSQALAPGYPMMWAYLTLEDLKKLCALQLVAQTNLVGSEYYLNLSGLVYAFDSAKLAAYFKEATAAAVLQVASEKAAAGSTAALQALGALGSLGTDSGAALLAAAGGGNAYAAAMVNLDAPGSYGDNLPVLGLVAQTAAGGTAALNTLIVTAATAAVSDVLAFPLTDGACVTPPAALDGSVRYRVAANLYGILMMGALQSQYGVAITPYADGSSSTVLSAADLATTMKNRINTAPLQDLVELKEWQALLMYLASPSAQGGLGGVIPSAYASTPVFTDFVDSAKTGAAVQVRNGNYPISRIGQLMTTLQTLLAAQ